MTTTQQPWPAQVSYPGQTHVAPGRHDMANMYRAHFAFRRDLARFESAVRQTPVGAADAWQGQAERWTLFAEVLHHHHTIEDVMIWPVLLRRTEAAGDTAGTEVLHAMEAEHDLIDPTLAACAEGFASMTTHPCADHRNALDVHVTTARELVADHLRHEETAALPLVQRLLSAEEWAAMESFADRGVPIRRIAALVPWVVHELPPTIRDRVVAEGGVPFRVLLALFGRRFSRREHGAFRYV